MPDQPIVKPETTQAPKPEGKVKGNKKWLLWGLIGFTGILLATAVILFLQLRKPVEEPLPTPKPIASPQLPTVKEVEAEGVCELTFNLEPPASPLPSPSPSPSTCLDECELDNDCEGDLRCIDVDGIDRCVNADCPEETDCECPGEELVCFDECVIDSECPGDLRCMIYLGTSDTRCLNADCRDETDCSCPGVVASPTPPASPVVRVEQPELPEAGVSTPAVLGVSAGLLMVIVGLLFF